MTRSNATPYPSPIAVSGLAGPITSVSISISGFTHTFPDDVGIVLVAPNGDALLVMDGAGDNPDVTGVDLTFADSGAAQLPNLTGPTTGTWKPTAYYTGDSFPAPGPLTAYGHPGPAGGNNATFASRFNGDAANGTWNLFVRDFSAGDGGSISDGWSITINTAIPTTTPTVTGTTPASPNGSTTPKVKGTSETGSTVSLYANSGCTGTPLGSGPAADFAGAGITATVPANASTTIYAKATKPAQSDSACSTTSVTYVQAAPDTTLTKTPKKKDQDHQEQGDGEVRVHLGHGGGDLRVLDGRQAVRGVHLPGAVQGEEGQAPLRRAGGQLRCARPDAGDLRLQGQEEAEELAAR